MRQRYYSYAGLLVASEVALPEWEKFEHERAAGASDVVILLGDGSSHEGEAIGETRFVVPGRGYFRVRDGSEIVVVPARGVSVDQLRPWLIGAAWGALCYQRGMFFIHASAVAVDGHAVLFCAGARGGKSTMAARLNTSGYALVSDDLCHLEVPASGVPLVYPSAQRFKLWGDAVADLGWDAKDIQPDQSRAGKFHVALPAADSLQLSPIRAIYLLEWGDLGITRLRGVTAWRRFLSAATYRAKLLESAGQLSRHSTRTMTVLQRVPVWELRRPRELGMIGKTVDILEKQWSAHRMMKE